MDTIILYTYEYLNKQDDSWCVSTLNWTTADALCEFLANKNTGTFRIVGKEFRCWDIINQPFNPFISDYAREKAVEWLHK